MTGATAPRACAVISRNGARRRPAAHTAMAFSRRAASMLLAAFVAVGAGCAAPTAGTAGPGAAPSGRAVAAGAQYVGPVTVVNPGFESNVPGIDGNPEGWHSYQHAGPLSYTFGVDREVKRSGKQSARIDNVGPEVYGTLGQILRGPQFAGKTIRFTAWIRTRDVTGNGWSKGTGLALTAYAGGSTIGGTNFRRTAFGGTTDWTLREVTTVAPAGTDRLDIEISMTGPGTVWIDDVTLEVLPAPR
ncbi:MAG: hypothetical protein ABI886_02020 [Betaproteobacteria bacterium]